MKKYKDMTYTVRKDGRLMKKITINNKIVYIYSNNEIDLYNQYTEQKYNSLKRFKCSRV